MNYTKYLLIFYFHILEISTSALNYKSKDFWEKNNVEELSEVESIITRNWRAKNVILFIGDGFGLSELVASRIFQGHWIPHLSISIGAGFTTSEFRLMKKRASLVFRNNTGSFFVLAPSVFYEPQLQIICCYIARYYVRK